VLGRLSKLCLLVLTSIKGLMVSLLFPVLCRHTTAGLGAVVTVSDVFGRIINTGTRPCSPSYTCRMQQAQHINATFELGRTWNKASIKKSTFDLLM
jgi:hypothetical protein